MINNPDGSTTITADCDYGSRYHDTVLELVDPVRGTLVASTRLEGSWSGFVGPDRIWRTWIDADGKAHTIVAAVGLSRRPDQEIRG